MSTDAYFSFINFNRQKITAKRDKPAGKYYLAIGYRDLHPSQQQLHTTFPIWNSNSNIVWFIDASGQRIFYEVVTNFANYSAFPIPIHKIDVSYNINDQFWFMDEGELHIICGDHNDSLSDTCHHLKYVEDGKIFVKMDDIVNDRELIAFSQRRFFYNSHQKRLYTIKFHRHRRNLRISYIDDINQWGNRWKLNNKRKWKTTRKSMRLDREFSRHLNQFQFVIVYDTILMMLVYNKLMWIDLIDLKFTLSKQYIISPKQFYKNARLLNIFDNYVYLFGRSSSIWSKLYLPHIIPKDIQLKYRHRMSVFINVYIKKLLNEYQLFYYLPQELIDLILCFIPVFLYF